ncbi:MAG TPA: tRNA (adenosine(37)-N6)-threonylcarbamoyltransferase complex transferase subunit TsaD [Hyphomonadaceae bacterium]|jgi:N6-L-threonylcarbamoyladenine synthase|nr:tRNA (adenosine(37)-N6)-threonylcarbamoyltransferase complex transferase subunit TsaD [Hyphomonadaceae bacterium]
MTQETLTVLGLETSCDETAAAIVRLGPGGAEVIAERVASQTSDHALYGGVVPEIAARAHVERIDGLIRLVMEEAGESWDRLSGIAATAGPGLIGGVMVGLSTAKAIALARGLPLIAVNHLEGHALSPRLAEDIPFPYLLLLVSGGHCQFVFVEGIGKYQRLGSTIDDAAGEAFDKTAKLLGLSGSGGPAVERAAEQGDPKAVDLPRPLLDRPGLDMSFSGLKTAVRRAAEEQLLTDKRRADICASFQAAVADILAARSARAMELVTHLSDNRTFVVAGGVAANRALRTRLEAEARHAGFRFAAPPLKWCTDNAAMIALAGAERLRLGASDPLDTPARARWPLDEASASAAPVYGAGKKGAKA